MGLERGLEVGIRGVGIGMGSWQKRVFQVMGPGVVCLDGNKMNDNRAGGELLLSRTRLRVCGDVFAVSRRYCSRLQAV